jgi:hypothetical protein
MKQRAKQFRFAFFDPSLTAWADQRKFSEIAFPSQRLLLFLRAIVKSPDIIVLDEPFSGLDAAVVQKCNAFLAHGETQLIKYGMTGDMKPSSSSRPRSSDLNFFDLAIFKGLTKDQALVFISHRKEEVPGVVREWLCLPEPGSGQAPRFGRFDGPLEIDPNRWRQVWGQSPLVTKRYNTRRRTDEEKRLAHNAYQRKYFQNETPEQKKKRSNKMKLYRLKVSVRKKEEYILRYFARFGTLGRGDKLLKRSYNTTAAVKSLLAELPHANTSAYTTTASVDNIGIRNTTSRNLMAPLLSTQAHTLLKRSDGLLLATEDLVRHIQSQREQKQVEYLQFRIHGRLLSSEVYITRAQKLLSKLQQQEARKGQTTLLEGERLLRGVKYRLNMTSKHLRTVKESKDLAL